jgi:hypothetical protein
MSQAANHGQNPVGDAFQLDVNLGKQARRLEKIEMPVEEDLVTNLGFSWSIHASFACGRTSCLK